MIYLTDMPVPSLFAGFSGAVLAQAGFDFEEAFSIVSNIAIVLLVAVVSIGFVVGGGYTLYFLFSLPRRRLERAMVFLNLVDSGIRRGIAPEDTIKSATVCCDNSVSVRFQLLAAWVIRGDTWREALVKVPSLLPPSITEMLLLSDQVGGWAKIFPVCQRKLKDVLSQLRARQSCLSPSIIILPIPILYVLLLLFRTVMPRFRALAADFEVEFVSVWSWLSVSPILPLIVLALLALVPLAILLLHIGGSRLWSFGALTGSIGDYLDWLVPWEKDRLKRDFAALLGLLLDAGVSEREAVEMAAQGTANSILKSKAFGVSRALAQGQTLVEALGQIDADGEFQWRFEQASAGGTRFEIALAGWCDALQSRADQLQQTAMQLLSVGLLLINAMFVGLIVFEVFHILIQITEKGLE